MSLPHPRFGLVALMVPLALAACAGDKDTSTASTQAHTSAVTNSYVQDQLAQAASRSADALQTLAMIERANSRPLPNPVDETGLPDALQRKVTLDWSGPAADVLSKLSMQIGYSFHETGIKPKAAVLVNVGVVDMPAAKVLEQIGMQAYPFGTVTVDPNISRVELHYLATPGATGMPAISGNRPSGRPMSLSAAN